MRKEKHIDESWKEEATQEKDILAKTAKEQSAQENKTPHEPPAEKTGPPTDKQPQTAEDHNAQAQTVEVNFLNYVTSLGFQTMIFMGEIPNPITNQTDKNLTQAKFLIDTLVMMKEKTEGNLNGQEKDLLESSIYELQMRYVQVSKNDASLQEGQHS